MLASAVLGITILVLASTTVSDIPADVSGNIGPYSGKQSTGYMTPAEVIKSLKGDGKPKRFQKVPAAA